MELCMDETRPDHGLNCEKLTKTPYPCEYLLDTVKSQGGHILLSADSHHKDNLTFYFDESVELLRTAGIDHIAVFNGKDFDLVGI